jgi:hypothetical protein
MDEFKNWLEEKEYAKKTLTQYLQFTKAYFDKHGDPAEQEQEEIVKNINDFNPISRRKIKAGEEPKPATAGKGQLIKSLVAYLKFKNKPHGKISELFVEINKTDVIRAKERNEKLAEELMPYSEYMKMVNDLYDTNEPEKLRQYIINKLLIHSNCRNADLNAIIITTEDEYKKMDTDLNYIYVDDENDIQFIRNAYKTASTYGTKITKIKSKKLSVAIRIMKIYTTDDEHHLIPKTYRNPNNLARYIKKMTFDIGEAKLLKIVLGENNSLAKAKKISVNRGTSLETLQQNYNIKQE